MALKDEKYSVHLKHDKDGKLLVNPTTLNSIAGFKGIQQDMVKLFESRGFNLGNQFGAIAASEQGRTGIKNSMLNRLSKDRETKKAAGKFVTQAEAKMAHDATLAKMTDDIKYLQGRLDMFFQKQMEATAFGEIKGFQQAVLPLLYLESIKNVGREIMPHKIIDGLEVPRQKVRNFLELPNGEQYNLLEAFRSPTIMRSILNSSNVQKAVVIEIGKVNDLGTLAGVGAGKSIMPAAFVSEIVINDGTSDITVKTGGAGVDNTGYASVFSRGKFDIVNLEYKDPAAVPPAIPATLAVINLNGSVDFEKGTAQFSGWTPTVGYTIKSAKLNVTFDGSDFSSVIRPFLKTEDKITSIGKRLNLSAVYDKAILQAHLKLDNIDRSIEFTAMMYDIVTNAKDFHVFDTVQTTWLNLSNSTIAKTLESEAFTSEFNMTPTVANYRPTHSREWAAAELPNSMESLMVKISKKMPTDAGIQFTYYGDPEATRLVPSLHVMVGGDESTYGGVKVDNTIMFARIGAYNAKIVSTQRAIETNYLQCVPYSNAENNELFAMYQFYTMFDQNNEWRSPLNPLLPGLNLIDIFDTSVIFPILGRVNFVA